VNISVAAWHAGLLYRQGVPPHATYRFKHALVQDAAYGTLLREPRRAVHARIAEILEGGFAGCVSKGFCLLDKQACLLHGRLSKASGKKLAISWLGSMAGSPK